MEGADWNDAFDMAPDKGESVAFTALYGSNLDEIGEMLLKLRDKEGTEHIEIASEIKILLDRITNPINYDSVEEKHELLKRYFDACKHTITGDKVKVNMEALSRDLKAKSAWIKEHIKGQEFIKDKQGYEWFNGYYDNNGRKVEGDHPNGVRMTLTGQVFAIMGNVASEEQIKKVIAACDRYLKDPEIGGYRLNTNFHEVKKDLGRCFGFAYGHKENGAVFSHMAIMYSNALYQRGFFKEGYEVIKLLYNQCKNFKESRIYPGIPEYINQKGRGMYHYLTGSASWLLLTILTQMYGIKGQVGDLKLKPYLQKDQFDSQKEASVFTTFANRKLKITYINQNSLEPDKYHIKKVLINNKTQLVTGDNNEYIIKRTLIEGLDINQIHEITVELDD